MGRLSHLILTQRAVVREVPEELVKVGGADARGYPAAAGEGDGTLVLRAPGIEALEYQPAQALARRRGPAGRGEGEVRLDDPEVAERVAGVGAGLGLRVVQEHENVVDRVVV